MSSSVSGVGAGGASAPQGDVTASLLHVIYEAQLGAPAQLGSFDLGQLNRQSLDNLQKALTDRNESLTTQEKEAFARGDKHELKAILERIQKKRLDAASLAKDGAAISQHRARDGVTNAKIVAPAASARADLPVDAPQSGKIDERDGRSAPNVERPNISGLLLRVRGEIDAPKVLAEKRLALLQVIAPRAEAAGGAKVAALGARDVVATPVGLAGVNAKALGTAVAAQELRAGFPASGRSGQAAALPTMQVVPSDIQKPLNALGIRSLADLLVRSLFPEGRILLAQVLGLPTTTLLLATLRAELLDLPSAAGRGGGPHLKDVLLLARLGLGSVPLFGRLSRVLERHPDTLDVFGKAVAFLQKANPEWVGRARLTRHELRDWAMAAEKRGSDVRLLDKRSEHALEAAADHTLVHALGLRPRYGEDGAELGLEARPANDADGDPIFVEVMARFLLLCQRFGLHPPDDLWASLRLSRAADAPRLETLAADMALAHEQGGVDASEWLGTYDPFVAVDDSPSLFYELAPWARPASERSDGLICFWVDPVPDGRHVIGISGLASDGKPLPESLKPAYVCLDPVSGAVAPHGAL